jgi:hypothetical protein
LCALQDTGFVVTYRGYLVDPDDPQTFYSNQLLAAKYDKNGNQVWHQWYPDDWANNGEEPAGRSLRELICLEDQTLIGLGEEEGYAGLILHINSTDGTLLNPIQVDDSIGDQIRSFWNGVETDAGDWIAVCYNFSSNEIPYLYKISRSGEVLIRKEFKFSSYHYGSRVLKGRDGSIFLVLSYNGSGLNGPNGIKVLRLDDNLTITATLDITDDLLRAFTAIPLQDNTIAISIATKPTNSEDIILLKTGMVPLVNTTSVVKNSTGISLFPNPIQKGSTVTVSLEKPLSGKATVKVLAADGKEVYSQTPPTHSDREIEINIPHLPAGIYTILLQTEGLFWTEKLMVR